jgi:hypothetical protein
MRRRVAKGFYTGNGNPSFQLEEKLAYDSPTYPADLRYNPQ